MPTPFVDEMSIIVMVNLGYARSVRGEKKMEAKVNLIQADSKALSGSNKTPR